MDQRATEANPHAASVAEDSPLRRYLAALEQGDDGPRLLRQIRLFVVKADLPGEQSAQEITLEVFQDVVVEALRSEARFDETQRVLPWLVGIAANVVKRRQEKLFRRRRNERVTADLTGDLSRDLSGGGGMTEEWLFDRIAGMSRPGPEQEVIASIGLEALLARLAPDERRLIELNVLYELNGSEVAGALGITPGAARVRLHRILAKLRRIGLEQEAGQEENQKR